MPSPADLVTDLAQLTKANSIEGKTQRSAGPVVAAVVPTDRPCKLAGNKKDNITVIYTPWSNLKKDAQHGGGQVSFKDPRLVKKVLVPQRENPIVNRLNKTKVEKQPDLQQEREDRQRELRKRDQAAQQQRVSIHAPGRHHWLNERLTAPRAPQKKEEARVARTTPTTSSSARRTWIRRATRTARPTGRTTSCSLSGLARLYCCSWLAWEPSLSSISRTGCWQARAGSWLPY